MKTNYTVSGIDVVLKGYDKDGQHRLEQRFTYNGKEYGTYVVVKEGETEEEYISPLLQNAEMLIEAVK